MSAFSINADPSGSIINFFETFTQLIFAGQKTRVDTANRRARAKGSIGDLKSTEFKALLAWFRCRCAYCNCLLVDTENDPQQLTLDHFTPVSHGGKTSLGNCLPACRTCNEIKSDAPAYYFLIIRFGRGKGRKKYIELSRFLANWWELPS